MLRTNATRTPGRKSLFNKYGGRCAYCGIRLPTYGWHRDHVEPLIRHRGVRFSFAGRNGCKNPSAHRADNIVAACSSCNLDKANFDLETWRASLRWIGWQKGVKFHFETFKSEG